MFPRVTAVLVVHHGGDHLRRTLDALRAQVRTPDALVIVLTEPDADARAQAAGAGATHVVELQEHLSFGEAVRAGERVLDAPASDADTLWLLAEDSAPEPEALRELVATLETGKSVAVAGPKLMDWEEPERIVGLGRTLTRLGRSVPIVFDELDQGQHDGLSDVLGLDPAAILVRHTVWQAVDGFDPALPTVDDGLDLGVRARLAGHRVAVVPSARVMFAVPMANVHESRVRYRIDDRAHIELRRVLRSVRPELSILGVYHSHPVGDAWPSNTDVAEALYPDWTHLIVGFRGRRPILRAFRIRKGTVWQVPLR